MAEKQILSVSKAYSCRELVIQDDFDLTVSNVQIRVLRSMDRTVAELGSVVLSAEGRCGINESVAARLAELGSGIVPSGSSDWKTMDKTYRPGDEFGNLVLPRRILPENVRNSLSTVERAIDAALKLLVEYVRWRKAATRFRQPLGLLLDQCRWRVASEEWRTLPQDLHARFLDNSQVEIGSEFVACLGKSIGEFRGEPASHELWREAWAIHGEGPRSALLMGVAAAEVGFKELTARLVPDAEWLVLNIPSPPLVTLIQEYLPKLPVRQRFDGEVRLPTKQNIDQLKKIVGRRNSAIHRGEPVSVEEAESALVLIRQLLWLFDFYGGSDWAKSRAAGITGAAGLSI